MYIQLFQNHFLKSFSFDPLNWFNIFFKKSISCIYVGIFLDSLFCSIGLYVSSLPKAHCLDLCRFVFKSGSISPPNLFSSFKIVLAIPEPMHFHIYFRISLSISDVNSKKCWGSDSPLTWICWWLWGEWTSLTMLCLPIPEYSIAFDHTGL